MSIKIRKINMNDVEIAEKIGYEAFKGIADKHNFPFDFPSVEAAQGFVRMWIGYPKVYGVAAENGEFVGSNF